MRLAIIGAVLLAAGGAAALFGVVPAADLGALVERVAPILMFVVAMTVVTELVIEAGLFHLLARQMRRWGRGSSALLWLLVAAVACLTTIFLSLDTTAVLLTPIVVTLARQAKLPPLPFVLTTVWLANTASMLLPISNLTNLLAQHAMGGISPLQFAQLMLAPALVAIVVPLAFIALVFRKDLARKYTGDADAPTLRGAASREKSAPDKPDSFLLVLSAVVLVVLLALLVAGMPVWIPSTGAAVLLAVVFAFRRPSVLSPMLVPWSLLLFASGLFLVMEVAQHLGAPALLSALSGQGEHLGELLRVAGTGLVGANLINNLPAYLALEQAAGTPVRLAALLIGVNAGVLITPWASLATLLWHDRLRKMNVLISWKGFAIYGLIVAPLTVALAVGALALVAG
ncbi:Arsenical pump membrane protein [Arthrobacter ulcerisalmonis]|uniref:Arsenical pump membrane protein n=1 Tax=Arthrobacter ulcerisalmonis TaxID=2483813 RepID=A0A3P5XAG8_9MICC|nr:SLC13 family permease [Arthrobacter ulcerisalmonis]VDC25457.1 Arsenical pump membrane protein [Arthrobacter ulcerisalmonis]